MNSQLILALPYFYYIHSMVYNIIKGQAIRDTGLDNLAELWDMKIWYWQGKGRKREDYIKTPDIDGVDVLLV